MTRSPRRQRDLTEVYRKGRRWRKLRAAHLDGQPLCQRCAAKGLTVAATIVHHVHAIADGGDPWDPGNLESICLDCHNLEHNPPQPVNLERARWDRKMGRAGRTRQSDRAARGFAPD